MVRGMKWKTASEVFNDLGIMERYKNMESPNGLIEVPAGTPPVDAEAENYRTVGQLQVLVATQTGKPCNSRNRPALLKKLGLADVARPAGMPKTGAPTRTVRQKAKAQAKAGVKAAKDKRAAKKQGKKDSKIIVKAMKRVAIKPTAVKSDVRVIIRSDATLHSTALRAVKAAMGRAEPPSLRALCAELAERKILTPRGKKKWMPSSIQSLMRGVK